MGLVLKSDDNNSRVSALKMLKLSSHIRVLKGKRETEIVSSNFVQHKLIQSLSNHEQTLHRTI